MPKKPQAPESPPPKIRRDSSGKIVEYDAGMVTSAPRVAVKFEPAVESSPMPKTVAQIRSEFSIRRALVEDSYREQFRRENVELSRQVGPAIDTRDRAVLAARKVLDKRISELRQDEDREIARVTKAVRQSFLASRSEAQKLYEDQKQASYDAANDVVRQVEAKLRVRSQEIKAKKDTDLAELARLQKEAEARVKAMEEKAATEAAVSG